MQPTTLHISAKINVCPKCGLKRVHLTNYTDIKVNSEQNFHEAVLHVVTWHALEHYVPGRYRTQSAIRSFVPFNEPIL